MRGRLRFLFPGIWLIPPMIGLSWIMDHGRSVEIALPLVNAASITFFIVLTASPLLLYPLAFMWGYRPWERVAAALMPLAWWWLTEVALRMEVHSPAESILLTFSVVNYLHYQLIALELVLAEIVCRLVARRHGGKETPLFSPRLVLAAVAVALVIASNPFSLEAYFSAHERLFHALFTSGELPAPERFVGPLPEDSIPPRTAGAQPPNLVFILSDDHRWDYMGNMGHPFVETPQLDRLAAEGIRFNNAFVVTSVCSPSRASFVTGLHTERHGVFNNFTPWNDQNRTFFEYLKQAGYSTAFIGKWHMPGRLPELRGVDEFVTFTVGLGQGLYFDCPLIVNGKPERSRKRYIAEELTDRAIGFMEAHRDRPFALYLAHKNVHAPFTPDLPESGRYRDQPVELPGGSHSWVNMTNAYYEQLVYRPMESSIRSYGEAVRSMDRQIGRILDRLEALGLEENTLVIYASDNGYLWGEHQLIDKRWAYEESIRIPFLVRYPAAQAGGPGESNRMILNTDLAPTLLDAAGLEIPEYMQGRSILPLLRDPESSWRDAFYYSYYREIPFPAPTSRAVRTDRYKYIEYQAKEPELFDLRRDPGEQDNLLAGGEEGELQERLRRRLNALRATVESKGDERNEP
jgi:N-acetylglucosamine-6-sulfatase